MTEDRQHVYDKIVNLFTKKNISATKLSDHKDEAKAKYAQTLERLRDVQSALFDEVQKNGELMRNMDELILIKRNVNEEMASYRDECKKTVEEIKTVQSEHTEESCIQKLNAMIEKYEDLEKIYEPEYIRKQISEMEEKQAIIKRNIDDLKSLCQDFEQQYVEATIEMPKLDRVFAHGEITGDLDANLKKMRDTQKTFDELKEKMADLTNKNN